MKGLFPVSCTVFFFFFLNEKTLLVLFIISSSFHVESTNDKVLSSSNRVKIYPG